jgi:hypothetical protein
MRENWLCSRSMGSRNTVTYVNERRHGASCSIVSDAKKVRFRRRAYRANPPHPSLKGDLQGLEGTLQAGGRHDCTQSQGWWQFKLQFAPHEGTRPHGCSCAQRHTAVPPDDETCRKKTGFASICRDDMKARPRVAFVLCAGTVTVNAEGTTSANCCLLYSQQFFFC